MLNRILIFIALFSPFAGAACMDWVTHLREGNVFVQRQSYLKSPLWKHVAIGDSDLEVSYPKSETHSVTVSEDAKTIVIDGWTILQLDENNKCKNVSVFDPFTEEPGPLRFFYYDWALCQQVIALNAPRDFEKLSLFIKEHQAEFDGFVQRARSAPFTTETNTKAWVGGYLWTPVGPGGPHNLVSQCSNINSSTADQANYQQRQDPNIPE